MGESRAVLFLASILSFRMLGLFIIYPVFAIYAPSYQHANVTLIGIALGIYGLSQALMQLPLSILSDRIGRKPVIYFGLILFALGSFLAGLAHNIYLLIIGRCLQGTGAIGSTLMAFCADLTTPKNRTKAMALLGMTIGLSFALAIVLGPLLNHWFNLSGIFFLTGASAILGLLLLSALPKLQTPTPNNYFTLAALQPLFSNKNLLTLNISILLAHAFLTALFSIVPLLLTTSFASYAQWKIYIPILLIAFSLTMPILLFAERKQQTKQLIAISFLLMTLAALTLRLSTPSLAILLFALLCFFIGFTILEALLPSLISKITASAHKGAAMGIFSTFQFSGIFIGGLLSGMIRAHYSNSHLFSLISLLSASWALIVFFYYSEQAIFGSISLPLEEELK